MCGRYSFNKSLFKSAFSTFCFGKLVFFVFICFMCFLFVMNFEFDVMFIELQHLHNPEAVAQRCSVKKLFLEFSQNSQENACARVSFLIKSIY